MVGVRVKGLWLWLWIEQNEAARSAEVRVMVMVMVMVRSIVVLVRVRVRVRIRACHTRLRAAVEVPRVGAVDQPNHQDALGLWPVLVNPTGRLESI